MCPVLCYCPADPFIVARNPRIKSGTDLTSIDHCVTVIVWPAHQITYLEVLPDAKEEALISFVPE